MAGSMFRQMELTLSHWGGRSRITEHGGAGSGFHPAIVRTYVRAFAFSAIPEIGGAAR